MWLNWRIWIAGIALVGWWPQALGVNSFKRCRTHRPLIAKSCKIVRNHPSIPAIHCWRLVFCTSACHFRYVYMNTLLACCKALQDETKRETEEILSTTKSLQKHYLCIDNFGKKSQIINNHEKWSLSACPSMLILKLEYISKNFLFWCTHLNRKFMELQKTTPNKYDIHNRSAKWTSNLIQSVHLHYTIIHFSHISQVQVQNYQMI